MDIVRNLLYSLSNQQDVTVIAVTYVFIEW